MHFSLLPTLEGTDGVIRLFVIYTYVGLFYEKRPTICISRPGKGSGGHRRICLIQHDLLFYFSLSHIYISTSLL